MAPGKEKHPGGYNINKRKENYQSGKTHGKVVFVRILLVLMLAYLEAKPPRSTHHSDRQQQRISTHTRQNYIGTTPQHVASHPGEHPKHRNKQQRQHPRHRQVQPAATHTGKEIAAERQDTGHRQKQDKKHTHKQPRIRTVHPAQPYPRQGKTGKNKRHEPACRIEIGFLFAERTTHMKTAYKSTKQRRAHKHQPGCRII